MTVKTKGFDGVTPEENITTATEDAVFIDTNKNTYVYGPPGHVTWIDDPFGIFEYKLYQNTQNGQYYILDSFGYVVVLRQVNALPKEKKPDLFRKGLDRLQRETSGSLIDDGSN